jgi:hypothetical protein
VFIKFFFFLFIYLFYKRGKGYACWKIHIVLVRYFEFACCIALDVFSFFSVWLQICAFVCNHVMYTTLHEVVNDFINLL